MVIDLLDDDVLDIRSIWDCSVITHSHFAYILNIKAHAAVLIHSQLATVPIGIFDAVKAVAALETGKTWFFSRLQSAEESRKGLIQAPQKVLQTGSIDQSDGIRVISADISKMRPLRSIANPLTRFLISCNPLFESSIVNQPGLPKQKVQAVQLLIVRTKKVFVGAQHNLTLFLHFNVPLDGFVGDVLYRSNVVTPAQHTRQSGAQLRELLA